MEEKDFILEVGEIDFNEYDGKYNSNYLGKIVVSETGVDDYFFLTDGSTYWNIPKELTAMVRTVIAQVKSPCQHEEKPFTSPYVEMTPTDDPEENHIKLQQEDLQQPEPYLVKIIALKTAGFTAEEIMAMAEKGLV